MKSIYLVSVLCLVLLSDSISFAFGQQHDPWMIIPAGQVSHQIFKVFVPELSFSQEMNPRLTLMTVRGNKLTELSPAIYNDQTWYEKIDTVPVSHTGALLTFNLGRLRIPWYKSCIRVYPVLRWTVQPDASDTTEVPGLSHAIIHPTFVFIGNRTGTIIYTAAIFVIFIFLSWLWTRKSKQKILGLISTSDGRLSMSLTQMALWTVVVGLMVVAFALLRLDVPQIPVSLIVLMGFAAGTSMWGHWQAKTINKLNTQRLKTSPQSDDQTKEAGGIPKLRTLFEVSSENPNPSIASAQIFFWTLITIVIFIYKSLLEGQLWDVPGELIGLMGVSQATFIARGEVEKSRIKLDIQKSNSK